MTHRHIQVHEESLRGTDDLIRRPGLMAAAGRTILVVVATFIWLLTPCVAAEAETDILWIEDWENPDWSDRWHVDFGTWEIGPPTAGPGAAFGGQNCAATVLAGNYPEPADTRLIRHTTFVVPAAGENPHLRFWHWFSFAAGDSGWVEVKRDGEESWEMIAGPYVATGCGTWTRPLVDLSAYAGETVQLALHFRSRAIGTFGDLSTGWYVDDLAVLTGALVFNDPEDWEGGLGDWHADRGIWEVGEPTTGPGEAFSGAQCAATVLGGNYCESRESRLISPAFRVGPPESNPNLRIQHWFSFAAGDSGWAEIRRAGEENWEAVLGPYTGTSGGIWSNPFADLMPYAGETVQLAFRFRSRAIGTFGDLSSGWYIDDVNPIATPVELASFTATSNDGIVRLSWSTSLRDRHAGFAIYRTFDGSTAWSRVSGDRLIYQQRRHYTFVDRTVEPGATYLYRLVAVDLSGAEQTFGPLRVTVAVALPRFLRLHANAPNPFNPATTITFETPGAGRVALRIFDPQGRAVRTLFDAELAPGIHAVTWDGRDETGKAVGSGTYLYTLQVGAQILTRKMTLIK